MMILTAALGLALLEAAPAGNETPRAETLAWRAKREADLKADQGWLAVSGLPWLKEGETTVGSGEGSAIRLADGPARWGTIERTGTKVVLEPAGGAPREITPKDDPFQIGRTWIQLIRRSDLVGLRLWDPRNARKVAFKGLRWLEVKDEYRVRGRLIPGASPAKVKIANVLGQVNDYVSPGVVEFELRGRKLRLTPVYETPEEDELFFIFKDATSGKTTYGAGRFLYSALPDRDGMVILDFNRAHSPPCAFTDFATCPLPPAQNRLEAAIEAGELEPHRDH
ncbi:MAG TPA: DUF1684 domain-containing protein [Vicinamibacteria bacterium]|nr:DUF1684 domain-containing protein [Vicinamibacteria bacterium]